MTTTEERYECPRPACRKERMFPDRSGMGFFKCPLCGGEFWPPDPEPISVRDIIEAINEDARRGTRGGGGSRGGGGKPAKRDSGWRPYKVQ